MNEELLIDKPGPENDALDGGLSYLDIVTAAFGSAIFLLFVFATLPLDQAGGAGADQYIDLQVEFNSSTQIELQIARNGQLVFRTLDPAFNPDPRTGASRLPDTDDYLSVHISNARVSATDAQVIGFRVIGPSHGTWSVFANAATTRNPFGASQESILVDVHASCAKPCEPDAVAAVIDENTYTVSLQSDGIHTEIVRFKIAQQ